MKTLQKIAESLHLNPSAADYLAGVRQYDRETFLAWCFRVGTDLTLEEIQALQWEFVEGATVRGPIGLRGASVTASIAPPLDDAIAELRQPSGPVFKFSEWRKTLRFFPRTYPPLDPDALRKVLKPAPAKREPRRFNPRGPNKPKPNMDEPVSIVAAETAAVAVEDPETVKARIRAQYADIMAPSECQDEAKPNRKPESWPFKQGQAYASPDEVGAFLGVCGRTVKKFVDEGKLRAVALGHSTLRVELESVREMLRSSAIGRAWRPQ